MFFVHGTQNGHWVLKSTKSEGNAVTTGTVPYNYIACHISSYRGKKKLSHDCLVFETALPKNDLKCCIQGQIDCTVKKLVCM